MIVGRKEAGTTARPKKTRSATARQPAQKGRVVVGKLIEIDQSGAPEVDYPGNDLGALKARTVVCLSKSHIGGEVVLMFEDADPTRPLIMGVIQASCEPSPAAKSIQARVDGEVLSLTAESEIVLQCGKASITLTRDGKIQIRGTYVLSRSSGVNRILGGSIELN
jgi:hypothetical protein